MHGDTSGCNSIRMQLPAGGTTGDHDLYDPRYGGIRYGRTACTGNRGYAPNRACAGNRSNGLDGYDGDSHGINRTGGGNNSDGANTAIGDSTDFANHTPCNATAYDGTVCNGTPYYGATSNRATRNGASNHRTCPHPQLYRDYGR